MSRKLIAGNWKMNGGLAANEALVRAMLAGIGQPAAQVALCAPAPYLAQMQSLLAGSPVAWGSQDVSAHEQGAYTGEVSAVTAITGTLAFGPLPARRRRVVSRPSSSGIRTSIKTRSNGLLSTKLTASTPLQA